MGILSKMTTLKVFEVFLEVSGFSGTVGFGPQVRFHIFGNFGNSTSQSSTRHRMSTRHLTGCQHDIDVDDLTIITIVMSASS